MPAGKKTTPQLAKARIGLKPGEQYDRFELNALRQGTRPEAIAAQRRIMARMERADLQAEVG